MPLSTKPEYPHDYAPATAWKTLAPREGHPASWHGGAHGIATALHQRQGAVFLEGPLYKLPIGRCVACLIPYPLEALEITHLVPYDNLAGKASGPQDLVNMHNDLSNLTLLCKHCGASRQDEAFFSWLLEQIRFEEGNTRLARVQVIRQAWAGLTQPADQKLEHAKSESPKDVLGALGRWAADPHASPRDQAAARMARVDLAIQKLTNELHFVADFHLAEELESLGRYLEDEAKRLLQGKNKPLP